MIEIKVGNITFGENSSYKLSSSIDGLESPSIRTGDGLYAGRDGGYMVGHYYSYRTITLKGFFIGENCNEASKLSDTLFNQLRIRKVYPIVINMLGNQYYTEGRVMSIKSDISNLRVGEFQISIACPDPILYLAENGSPIIKTASLVGGFSTNLFNKGDTTFHKTLGILGVEQLDTGVRVISDGSRSFSAGCRYKICNISDIVGKTITLSADIVTPLPSTNRGAISIWRAANDNITAGSRATTTFTTSGHYSVSYTFTEADITTTYQVVSAGLYIKQVSGEELEEGDYMDFENVMLTIGDEPGEYQKYGKYITEIVNNGSAIISPTITTTGVIDGLTITNETLGRSLTADIATTSDTDIMVVDMEKRLITLNGELKNNDRSTNSEWWNLSLGENIISTEIGESAASVELKFKEGEVGI